MTQQKQQKPYALTHRAKANNTSIPDLIKAALEKYDTIEQAADSLKISHPTLLYHMRVNGISIQRCRRVVVETKSAS